MQFIMLALSIINFNVILFIIDTFIYMKNVHTCTSVMNGNSKSTFEAKRTFQNFIITDNKKLQTITPHFEELKFTLSHQT